MVKVIKALLKSRNSSQNTGGYNGLSDKVVDNKFILGTVSGGRGGGLIAKKLKPS